MNKRTDGYNPLRHDCKKHDCWNEQYRPKIEFYADCFPRNIGMTDLDATVEIGGNFLILEWKSNGQKLNKGQQFYFERLTKLSNKITVVIVSVDTHPEDITHCQVMKGGNLYDIESCDFGEFRERLRKWAIKADGKPF